MNLLNNYTKRLNMKRKKNTKSNGEFLFGKKVIDLLHDFYLSGNGDRIMIVPSLNYSTPGLFDNSFPRASLDEYDDDQYDVSSLDLAKGTLRIITDTKNHSDWQVMEDFCRIPGIEIRHYKKIRMNLFAHLKEKYSFCVETPLIADVNMIDFADRAIAFKVSSNCKDVLDYFEELWEEADEIDFGD